MNYMASLKPEMGNRGMEREKSEFLKLGIFKTRNLENTESLNTESLKHGIFKTTNSRLRDCHYFLFLRLRLG